ncbi:hypothetical protein D3OALGB2SA_799 [Olavius algarvensis associated proteobacterium Delta 3]|nr:hypothetical protein D3OALGB2SA_799 [Olavius algarvensis associated proteobacterium Delta 3]
MEWRSRAEKARLAVIDSMVNGSGSHYHMYFKQIQNFYYIC